MSKSEEILAAARLTAQAHGYSGLNFRDLADAVGIKAASIYHHFRSKADLGAAIAKRYWEDAAADLEALRDKSPDALSALRAYPQVFRWSLERDNRLCMSSFMSAEHDDLPEEVKSEIQIFADINVAWLAAMLIEAGLTESRKTGEAHARAIFASVAGAQLMARSRSDIALFDGLIETYRATGLLPS